MGNWETLVYYNNMFPFVVAAGYHNCIYSLPKGNEQPDEPSTICISVFHERSIWCAKKADSFKCITSDMAHGQT